jgi:hypothetical protein
MASISACGADFMKSRLRLGIVAEHAASMKPHAVTAMHKLNVMGNELTAKVRELRSQEREQQRRHHLAGDHRMTTDRLL